jgi:predicted nucleic acid-binding Zn ribbon protein
MQNITINKTCITCGRAIKGRSDKKFCDDYCRSAFNNKQHQELNPCIRNINNILRKNRRILEEMIPDETAKTTKARLIEKGFNFQYVTSTYTNKKGMMYYFCYDYGYLPLENDWFFLMKRNQDGS